MTAIKALGTLLTASVEDRVLTYRLLPYGEPGRTNVGTVTASAGTLTIPEDVTSMVANLEHDAKRPLAKFVRIEETDAGLDASVRVLPTSAGNDLLIEAAERVRTGISVEIENPVIRDGALVGGALTGAGFVTTPAFPSAQLVACDCGQTEDETEETTADAAASTTDSEPAAAEGETPDQKEEGDMPEENIETLAASAPAGGPAAMRGRGGVKVDSAESLFAQLAAAHSTGNDRMLAALDQAVQADVIGAQQPQWAGEIWASRTHRQKYVPLFARKPLNSLRITGWEFDVRTGTPPQPLATPTVGSYSGFPAEPTSTEVKTKAVTINAQRLAGANAIDRAFVDFSTPEFWEGYYREAANDLSRKLDAAALAHMVNASNYTEVEAGTVPSGVATALSYIVDGVLAIQDIAVPDFAIVGTDLWRALALTKQSDAVEYLSVAVGLDPAEGRLENFTIVPSSDSALTGAVLVGASEAHSFYGEKSVRVDTVNIGTGGVETGVFSYHALHTGTAKAFALVAPGE